MTHNKEEKNYDTYGTIPSYDEEYNNPYDENYMEDEYYESIEQNGYCENCGSPLKKYYEVTEFWGNKEYTPVYYCPYCD